MAFLCTFWRQIDRRTNKWTDPLRKAALASGSLITRLERYRKLNTVPGSELNQTHRVNDINKRNTSCNVEHTKTRSLHVLSANEVYITDTHTKYYTYMIQRFNKQTQIIIHHSRNLKQNVVNVTLCYVLAATYVLCPRSGELCFHFVCPDLCPVPRTLSVQASPFLSQPGLFRRAGESIPVHRAGKPLSISEF